MDYKIALHEEMSIDSFIKHLKGLIDGLETGKLLFEKGSDFIVLMPSSPVDVNFEVVIDEDNTRCHFELSWPQCDAPEPKEPLRISNGCYA